MAEMPELEKAGADGEVQARDDHQRDQGKAPEHAIQPVQKIDHSVCFLPFFNRQLPGAITKKAAASVSMLPLHKRILAHEAIAPPPHCGESAQPVRLHPNRKKGKHPSGFGEMAFPLPFHGSFQPPGRYSSSFAPLLPM